MRKATSRLLRALLVLILVIAGVGFFCLIRGAYTSMQAEITLHKTYFVANMLEAYVSDNCRWPKSWDELEPYRLQEIRLQEKKLGHPKARPEMMEEFITRVDIRFDFDDRLPTDEDFENDPPFQPHSPYYVGSFERDLEYVRKAVERCRTY